ncbi:DUF7319 domain-containing protein [Haloarchaeobius amylolyticus]|uniref:DUF7319 domain-containing protein n=1 Tax=Haloarchaeobius amylolyticus TaxID=1198296 RepID=UPI00226FA571|nr:hypothetical protein [Haloarchaeobius amylolyticus]
MTRPIRADGGTDADVPDPSEEELRRRVEETYDFENFGPQDMAEMSYEEWDAVFDPDSWIVGQELLERVQQDLRAQVAARDVFAIVERVRYEGEECVLAYSDEGYALVFPDGSTDGFGTVLRDVKPTVALCSMDDYEPSEAQANAVLPHPEEVPEGSGQLGNWMLQAVAFVLSLSALALFGGAAFLSNPGLTGDSAIARGVMVVAGIIFLLTAIVLFLTVANARLSDRFRAKEYKQRLRAVGLEDGERPEFLPDVEFLEDSRPETRRTLDEPSESPPEPDS